MLKSVSQSESYMETRFFFVGNLVKNPFRIFRQQIQDLCGNILKMF